MKTISEYITLLSSIKNTMTSKLNGHGLNTTGNTMLQMANKIGDIESGLRLNIFSQTTQPETYDGIWINTDQTVNKLAQVEDFLSEWNSTYVPSISINLYNAGCAYYNGKVYIIGGRNGSSVVNTVYIYDIATNKWTNGNTMPVAKQRFGCVAYNGKIYCIGGYITGSVNTNYIYDIATDSWSSGQVMPTSKGAFGCAIHNDKIYCIGGYTTTTITTNNIYDITNNSWSTGTVIPVANHNFGCVEYDGNIYCIGGKTSRGAAINTTRIYSISGNSWSTGTIIPNGKFEFVPIAYNGKIYCAGGTTGTTTNINNIYNIGENSWSTGTAMPVGKYSYGCILYNSKIYYFCGASSANILSTSYIYSPDGPVNIALYNSDTLIIQHVNSYQPYSTILTSSNTFIGSYKIPFTDVAINSINADIYYGDGSQWIKIKSAT